MLRTNNTNNTIARTITAANAASIVALNAAPIITPIMPINNAERIAITSSKQEHFLFLHLLLLD